MLRLLLRSLPILLLACLLPGGPAYAGDAPRLVVEPSSPRPIGTTLLLSAVAPDGGRFEHRFSVVRVGGEDSVFVDYSAREALPWTPADAGVYRMTLSSRNLDTGRVSHSHRVFWAFAPLARAAVIDTRHPLVPLYSARHGVRPRCAFGRCTLRVHALREGSPPEARITVKRRIRPGTWTTAFPLAGLRAASRYRVRHEIVDRRGRVLARGPVLHHETGELPFEPLPVEVLEPPTGEVRAPLLLSSPVLGDYECPLATDLEGEPLWFDPNCADRTLVTRSSRGGRFQELVAAEVGLGIVREVDLLGNLRRETTTQRLAEQLEALGARPISELHHEARRLPGGRTVVLGYDIATVVDQQGPGPVDVISDVILVLDRHYQLVWSWNALDHLDLGREAVLGDVCERDARGCPVLQDTEQANDWLHSNAVEYDPKDGSLLLSVRHQDWVVKIDYADGRGDGRVLWRLGEGGDFALDASGDWPWFSHPHDPSLLPDGRLVIYDNGNTRCRLGRDCESRGQVYSLDEVAMTARLEEDFRLGVYSFALGSAHGISGGGFHFDSGLIAGPAGLGSIHDEFAADGSPGFALHLGSPVYRSFRMRDLYTPPPRP